MDRRGLNDVRIAHAPLPERGLVGHERDASYAYLRERRVAVFDVLNGLVHRGAAPRQALGSVRHDGHELPLKAVDLGGQHLIFATFVSDEELERIFAPLPILH